MPDVPITVARGRGGGGPHPGLTGARPSPPPPSPAPPRGLTRDALSRGGSSLPDPARAQGHHGRATAHAHAAPYLRLPATARPRPAPAPRRGTTRTPPRRGRGRAARAAPPLTQNNTNYKSTKRVTPLYSAQTVRTAPNAHLYHLPMRTQKARLGETDRVTLPGPAGIAARQRCVMIWSQLSIGSVVSSVYLDPGVFRARA